MPLRFFRSSRADTLSARIERTRDDGYFRGFAEGKLFRLAVGETFERWQALDWLDNVVEEGRTDLIDQHANLSCRIAFLLEIAP